jgi:hypothetical protein
VSRAVGPVRQTMFSLVPWPVSAILDDDED